MKSSKEIRESFINFWTRSPRNCKLIPNMSLVPNVDSTLLFVNSGMFPLASYLGGESHPLGQRLCNIQRCLRTNYDEMIEIGDNRHTLMFEMMGNWSLGDFFKKEQIPWILEFWVEVCGLDPSRIYVSVFEGDEDSPRDDEAIKIWQGAFQKYGVDSEFSPEISNLPKNLEEGKKWKARIYPFPKKKNWWERAHAAGELGGPTSEMFYDLGEIQVEQSSYNINDDSGRFIEIGNNVFMQYKLDSNLKWQNLPQKNIDFGGGFERVVMIVQGKKDIYETDIYMPIIQKIENVSGKSYKTNGIDNEFTANFRIIADHVRAATFILADGVTPSNKDQGYILRRFIRRLVRFGKKLGLETDFAAEIARVVIENMSYAYPHLAEKEAEVIEKIAQEEKVFKQTLNNGLKNLQKILESKRVFNGKMAFDLYETYGFPLELTLDELNLKEDETATIIEEFKVVEEEHRNKSRTGAEQKFKGGLADQSRETTKLHTAHHLLLAALQKIVDPNIKQRGSNITAERLRIDFNLDRKLTEEEIKKVEDLVNEKIKEGLLVKKVEMSKEDAQKLGAQMEFGQKYGELVSVYFIEISENPQEWFSAEFCGGPHVSNTLEIGEIGKKFKIFKEESSSSGIRRIKAGLV